MKMQFQIKEEFMLLKGSTRH